MAFNISNMIVAKEKMCRTCLATSDLVPLFENDNILKMLETCIHLDIKSNDRLPKDICLKCISEIRQFFRFYNLCHLVNEKLKDFEKSENVTNDEKTITEYLNDNNMILDDDDILIIKVDNEDQNETENNSEEGLGLERTFVNAQSTVNADVAENIKDPNQNENADTELSILIKSNQTNIKTMVEKRFIQYKKVYATQNEGLIRSNSYICEICRQEFTRLEHLEKHQDNHKRELNVLCEICGTIFDNTTSLNEHYNTHDKENMVKLVCEKCLEEFANFTDLQKHLQGHGENYFLAEQPGNENLIFICETCKEPFNSISELKVHGCFLKKLNSNEELLVENLPEIACENIDFHFLCEICNNFFTNLNDLNLHMSMHDAKGSSTQKKCTKTSTEKSVNHTLNVNFVCSICDKTFIRRKDFEHHVILHTIDNVDQIVTESNVSDVQVTPSVDVNTVNFKCEICNQEFRKSEDFEQHKESHKVDDSNKILENNASSETIPKTNLFSCTICKKVFTEIEELQRHFKMHETTKKTNETVSRNQSNPDIEQNKENVTYSESTNVPSTSNIKTNELVINKIKTSTVTNNTKSDEIAQNGTDEKIPIILNSDNRNNQQGNKYKNSETSKDPTNKRPEPSFSINKELEQNSKSENTNENGIRESQNKTLEMEIKKRKLNPRHLQMQEKSPKNVIVENSNTMKKSAQNMNNDNILTEKLESQNKQSFNIAGNPNVVAPLIRKSARTTKSLYRTKTAEDLNTIMQNTPDKLSENDSKEKMLPSSIEKKSTKLDSFKNQTEAENLEIADKPLNKGHGRPNTNKKLTEISSDGVEKLKNEEQNKKLAENDTSSQMDIDEMPQRSSSKQEMQKAKNQNVTSKVTETPKNQQFKNVLNENNKIPKILKSEVEATKLKEETNQLKISESVNSLRILNTITTRHKSYIVREITPDYNNADEKENSAKNTNVSKNLLVTLQRLETDEQLMKLSCKFCGIFFTEEANLLLHQRIHTNLEDCDIYKKGNSFCCPHCPKIYFRRDFFERHLKNHTNETFSGERRFFCEICKQSFKLQIQLNRHKLIHVEN